MTTTVYLFGLSEESGEVVAYAYRSTADFTSEHVGYGVGVKPECSVPDGNLIEHIPTMMEEQRALQAAKPLRERVFIGGEAMAIHLTRDGCSISRLFEFSDFKDQLTQVFEVYPRNAH